LELVESFDTADGHGRLVEKLTDEAGRFEGGNPLVQGGSAYGERHNIELELERRTVSELAKNINKLVKGEKDFWDCYFAASKEINHQLLQKLEPEVRARIVKNVPEDLTNVDESELLGHFSHSEVGRE
jgi:hypothetical protein